MAGNNTCDGSSAQNDSGSVKLGVLYAGLDVGGGKILLGVLGGVVLAGLGDAVGLGLVDLVNGLFGLLGGLAGLDSGLTGHDRADNDAGDTGSDQELGALLLNLEADLVEGQAHRLHDFVFLHG